MSVLLNFGKRGLHRSSHNGISTIRAVRNSSKTASPLSIRAKPMFHINNFTGQFVSGVNIDIGYLNNNCSNVFNNFGSRQHIINGNNNVNINSIAKKNHSIFSSSPSSRTFVAGTTSLSPLSTSRRSISTLPPLVAVCGPSGVGKDKLIDECLAHWPQAHRFTRCVSHTTRAPREGEEHGRDYFFVSEEEFNALKERGGFVETAHVHGRSYGTSIAAVRQCEPLIPVLNVDVQGIASIQRILAADAEKNDKTAADAAAKASAASSVNAPTSGDDDGNIDHPSIITAQSSSSSSSSSSSPSPTSSSSNGSSIEDDTGNDIIGGDTKSQRHVLCVFIAPPGIAELRRRLVARGTETEEQVNLRVANAEKEMHLAEESAEWWDAVIINDEIDDAIWQWRRLLETFVENVDKKFAYVTS